MLTYVDEEDLKALRNEAFRQGISRSELCRLIFKEYLNREEENRDYDRARDQPDGSGDLLGPDQ